MNATLVPGLLIVVLLVVGLIVAVLLGGSLHDAMPSLPSVAELMAQ